MRITQSSVAALEARDKKWYAWDEKVRGFGVRINSDGSKTYLVKYRVEGKQRKKSIGRAETMKAEDARRRAMKMLVEAAEGIHSGGLYPFNYKVHRASLGREESRRARARRDR
ncbi:MAG: Arm DNA-binding domain-containing protein [Henriciella sp.]|nr:Arm DNA-binding domain-containing protein [Henriciella sp.]